MAILGERPETGVRIAIERARGRADGRDRDAPPWSYTGTATLPEASYPLRVTVTESGEVSVVLEPESSPECSPGSSREPPADLAERVRLIVRTVYRQAKADDEPPAWRIVRWRARD